MNPSTILDEFVRKTGRALRLRGPLAGDPTAKVLHALVLGSSIWMMFNIAVILPFVTPAKALSIPIDLAVLFILIGAHSLLQRGSLPEASLVYVGGTGLIVTLMTVLSGGIHSIIMLVFYIALPISTAWLLGFQAALGMAAACLVFTLALALLDLAGLRLPSYFPGKPLGVWSNVLYAMVTATVPTAQILKTLKGALAASRRDVVERTRAEEELRKHQEHLEELVDQRTAELVDARDQAQAANRAKSTFLARMSHELRTPLNAILGFSSLMRDQPNLSERQCADLEIINRSGRHLLDLIDDVLDVCKIEAGRVVIENTVFDLSRLIRDVTNMMQGRAQEKNLGLFLDPGSEFPRLIRADPSKLRQTLINLIGNAVKYTDSGEVWVRLNAKPMEVGEGLLLAIEVEDTGIGVPPEDQERIFEAFVQSGNSAHQKGTGLGLSITRQFVQLMGGTIVVQSTPGKGSLFRMELPVQESKELVAETERERIIGLAPGQPDYRILIVEDEPVNALLLQRLLEEVGFHVRLAENGVQGIDVFQAWRPHFIWMDRRMLVMDGMEATLRIRHLDGGQDVKIACVSASVLAGERDEVAAAGFDDFVRKPYVANAIFDCMERLLGVRYIVERSFVADERPDETICAEALAAIPEELLEELEDALVCLDIGRIATQICRVSEIHPGLGDVFRQHAERLAFTTILRGLQNEKTNYAGRKAI